MSNYVNTTIETREAEVNYIVEIHKDMRDNCKHWYTNSYDFSNGDRVKITVEITKNWATAVNVAETCKPCILCGEKEVLKYEKIRGNL